MAYATIQLQGAKELQAALVDLDRKVQRDIVRKALRAGAAPIRAAAQNSVPVKSGRLRKSIKIRSARKLGKGQIGILVSAKGTKASAGEFYGGFVEKGHFVGKRIASTRSTDKAYAAARYHTESLAAGRRFIPGVHYMEHAFESRAQEAADLVVATMWGEIQTQIDRANSRQSAMQYAANPT